VLTFFSGRMWPPQLCYSYWFLSSALIFIFLCLVDHLICMWLSLRIINVKFFTCTKLSVSYLNPPPGSPEYLFVWQLTQNLSGIGPANSWTAAQSSAVQQRTQDPSSGENVPSTRRKYHQGGVLTLDTINLAWMHMTRITCHLTNNYNRFME
jgi:hypothetical protein